MKNSLIFYNTCSSRHAKLQSANLRGAEKRSQNEEPKEKKGRQVPNKGRRTKVWVHSELALEDPQKMMVECALLLTHWGYCLVG